MKVVFPMNYVSKSQQVRFWTAVQLAAQMAEVVAEVSDSSEMIQEFH
jgi:hypothetical protein